jgi:hypothetical protein
MTVQRTKPHNPTLAHLVPGAALLALAAAFVALGFILRLTVDASPLPQDSWREAQRGVQIAFQVAGYAGALGVVLIFIGMLSYTLDLMRLWSAEPAAPAQTTPTPQPSQEQQIKPQTNQATSQEQPAPSKAPQVGKPG